MKVLGLLTKIGLNDFRNGHSDFETIVDGLDEDDKSLPGSHHTVNMKSQDLD